MNQMCAGCGQRPATVRVQYATPAGEQGALLCERCARMLVARAGGTVREQLAESRRRLDGVGAHVLGCVLNATSPKQAAGYYAAYTAPAVPAAGR